MTDDLMAELAAEAGSVGPSRSQQATLTQRVTELALVEQDIDKHERQLKQLAERRNELRHKTIPDLMVEVGQDRVGLPDFGEYGADVVLKPYFKAVLPKIDEKTGEGIGPEPGLDWLEKNGFGHIIRTFLSVQLGKDDLPLARALERILPALPGLLRYVPLGQLDEVTRQAIELIAGRNEDIPPPSVDRTIPWASLTAFVREQTTKRREEMSRGVEPDTPALPLDLLGAIVGSVAEVKMRKG